MVMTAVVAEASDGGRVAPDPGRGLALDFWGDLAGTVDRDAVAALEARRPLVPAGGMWRLAAIHSVVIGPSQFNAGLAALDSKSQVHFAAFARLLRRVWDRAADGVTTSVTSDKHGGRHY